MTEKKEKWCLGKISPDHFLPIYLWTASLSSDYSYHPKLYHNPPNFPWQFVSTNLNSWVERGNARVKHLLQEQVTIKQLQLQLKSFNWESMYPLGHHISSREKLSRTRHKDPDWKRHLTTQKAQSDASQINISHQVTKCITELHTSHQVHHWSQMVWCIQVEPATVSK